MYPYLLGKEFLPMYGLLLSAGLLLAMLLFKIICNRKKVEDKTYSFYSLLYIISIGAGLGGAALFQLIYDAIDAAVHHTTAEYGGLTFMGGLITGVAVFVAGSAIFAKGKVKRDFFECASYAAPCISLGHMFGRIGCFCAGCCYGRPTSGPLGVVFPDLKKYTRTYPEYVATGGRAYPTQLFEAAFLALLTAALLIIALRFNRYKPLLIIYGGAYSVFRFFIEFIRGDDRGSFIPGLTPSQTQSIVLLLVAAALAVCVYKFRLVPFARAKDKEKPPEDAAPEINENSK